MLELDNSKRSQFVNCPKKYYYQYIRNLRSSQGSTALRYGTVWHSAMDAFYNSVKEKGWIHDGGAIEAALKSMKESWDEESNNQTYYSDYRTLESCIQCLIEYTSHFNHDEGILKVRRTERPFKLLMPLTLNEEKYFPLITKEGLAFTGKIDAEVFLNERKWQLEHKTTGQAISMQKKRLHRSPQLIGYAYAGLRLNPEDPPEGSLVVLHHLSARKSTVTGEYGKLKIEFERIPQIFTEGDFISWRLSFLDTAESILKNIERNFWPVQLDNCYQYGRCTYAPLCEQNSKLGEEFIDDFFETEPWNVADGVDLII